GCPGTSINQAQADRMARNQDPVTSGQSVETSPAASGSLISETGLIQWLPGLSPVQFGLDWGQSMSTFTGGIMPVIMPIYGTRPEAIKMAPIVAALNASEDFDCVVTVTGQHREMLDQVNELFGIAPDHDLDILQHGQSLSDILTRTINGLDKLFAESKPDAVIVQGDTTTSTAGAIAAFYRGIPVIHAEAGLRSHDLFSPFPEEANRKITTQIASLHLAPTSTSKANLVAESVNPDDIVITGNTVIDALLTTVDKNIPFTDPALEDLAASDRKILLVTTHRREN